LKVHLKKSTAWSNIGSPKIHFWDTNNSNNPASTTWPGITMTPEGNGWYVYSFSDATQANIVFNNNSYPQSPDQTAIMGGEKWCQMEGPAWKWYGSNPDQPVAGFDWRNATIYQVLIDRFVNGSTGNDNAYGRELDANGVPCPGFKDKQGTFHGGDLKGLTAKVQEGYFDNLGVAAIWITSPYEQVHGWIPDDQGFRFYSYHGYWPLDFTEVDANFGTYDDLVDFVDSAHARGIRVILDVVLNHAGYYTLKDMSEFNFGTLKSGWKIYYYDQPDSQITLTAYDDYIDVTADTATSWSRWWGKDWLRLSIDGLVNGTPLPGYDPFGPGNRGAGLYGLPDFKTESQSTVSIPALLNAKWNAAKKSQERNELNAFFTSTGRAATVRNHLIKWLTDWVVKLGIDGFRCDTAAHVELEAWANLKSAAQSRLSAWKAANPNKKIDDSPFWMVGEGSDINPDGPEFYQNGFDAMLNFRYRSDSRFTDALSIYSTIDSLYAEYAAMSDKNQVTFISNHDYFLFNDGNAARQKRGLTLLLLTPRSINLLYGDENARTLGPSTWDEQQRIRSDIVFPGNADVLEHCEKVGQFRKKHRAIGAGAHVQIQATPYTFSRILGSDRVICVLGASGEVNVPVAAVFTDGTTVRDYYTGVNATVINGSATFAANANGVILIESIAYP
jgi:alpha-amylase